MACRRNDVPSGSQCLTRPQSGEWRVYINTHVCRGEPTGGDTRQKRAHVPCAVSYDSSSYEHVKEQWALDSRKVRGGDTRELLALLVARHPTTNGSGRGGDRQSLVLKKTRDRSVQFLGNSYSTLHWMI